MKLGEMTLEEAAKVAAGNWRKFESFAWHRARDLDDADNWAIVYTNNRDSGLLDQSNAAAIDKAMEPFTEADDPDVVAEHHHHWACGWIDGYSIRVYRNGQITEAFKELLKNPACIGLPCYNKYGGGRFWEFIGGEMRTVAKDRGRVKSGRVRDKSDWIGPEKPLYKPLVPVERFNRVQRKLEQSSKEYTSKVKPRSPRTASFWLRNLLICSGCNRPMRAWNANNNGNPYRSYFCSNYGEYGIENPTHCQSNRIKAELLETIVETYLAETHDKISQLLRAKDKGEYDHLSPLEGELEEKRKELFGLQLGMMKAVHGFEKQHGDVSGEASTAFLASQGIIGNKDNPLFAVPTTALYAFVFQKRKPDLERELSELDNEHTGLVDRVLSLPRTATAAIEKAGVRIVELEGRMSGIKAELNNLGTRFGELVQELEQRQRAIEKARETISGDASYRRKSALVASVIEKVICYFQATGGKGRQARSQLVKVEITPQQGNSVSVYPDGNKPEPC